MRCGLFPGRHAAAARRRVLRTALACAGAALGGWQESRGDKAPAAGLRVIEERRTQFGRLAVVERGRRRYLAYGPAFEAGFMYQSVLDLDRPLELAAPYTRLMMLGAVYAEPARLLQIGVGAGNMTGYALRTFPQAVIDAVDIDADTLAFGAKYFGLAPHPRMRLHVADGRAWLAAHPGPFDVAMLDAYDDRSIPPALADAAFYALVAARLAPGGAAVQNVYLPKVDVPRLAAALRSAFAQVDAYRIGDSLVLVAHQGPPQRPGDLLARARALDAALRPTHPLADLLQHRAAAP